MKRSHSYFEQVDSHFSDSPTLKSQKSVYDGARISKPPPSLPKLKIIFIKEMTLFMHKHIEGIANVKDDNNCNYQTVTGLLGRGEYNHFLSANNFWKSWEYIGNSTHRYTVKKEHFGAIHNALTPCASGLAPFSKWICFPKMGLLIASAYNMACIDLTRYDFSETFFQFGVAHLKILPNISCALDGF